MDKKFVIFVVILVVGFFGFIAAQKRSDTVSAPDTAQVQPTQNIFGKADSKVSLIEYADFQCPACAQIEPVLKQVREKYKADISFQFRNYPLVQIHQNALAAHRTAEAAAKQGQFWAMHDVLYERQAEWSKSSNPYALFEGYASQAGLNLTQYKKDAASSAVNDIINADIKEAQKLGVDSTPTFIYNGQKLKDFSPTFENFSKLIDDSLKSTDPTLL